MPTTNDRSDIARSVRKASPNYGLTQRQLQTCALAWADKRSLTEIAAIQGITVSGVQHRLTAARRRLKAAGMIPPTPRPRPLRKRPVPLYRWEDV